MKLINTPTTTSHHTTMTSQINVRSATSIRRYYHCFFLLALLLLVVICNGTTFQAKQYDVQEIEQSPVVLNPKTDVHNQNQLETMHIDAVFSGTSLKNVIPIKPHTILNGLRHALSKRSVRFAKRTQILQIRTSVKTNSESGLLRSLNKRTITGQKTSTTLKGYTEGSQHQLRNERKLKSNDIMHRDHLKKSTVIEKNRGTKQRNKSHQKESHDRSTNNRKRRGRRERIELLRKLRGRQEKGKFGSTTPVRFENEKTRSPLISSSQMSSINPTLKSTIKPLQQSSGISPKDKFLSEMTTISPFLHETRALDYLSSFETSRKPKRWPIRLVLPPTNEHSPVIPQSTQIKDLPLSTEPSPLNESTGKNKRQKSKTRRNKSKKKKRHKKKRRSRMIRKGRLKNTRKKKKDREKLRNQSVTISYVTSVSDRIKPKSTRIEVTKDALKTTATPQKHTFTEPSHIHSQTHNHVNISDIELNVTSLDDMFKYGNDSLSSQIPESYGAPQNDSLPYVTDELDVGVENDIMNTPCILNSTQEFGVNCSSENYGNEPNDANISELDMFRESDSLDELNDTFINDTQWDNNSLDTGNENESDLSTDRENSNSLHVNIDPQPLSKITSTVKEDVDRKKKQLTLQIAMPIVLSVVTSRPLQSIKLNSDLEPDSDIKTTTKLKLDSSQSPIGPTNHLPSSSTPNPPLHTTKLSSTKQTPSNSKSSSSGNTSRWAQWARRKRKSKKKRKNFGWGSKKKFKGNSRSVKRRGRGSVAGSLTVVTTDNGIKTDDKVGQTTTKSPFVGSKNAFDFLSNHKGIRRWHVNEKRRESYEFNRVAAESMCEAFDKHFVPTNIGGKCV